MLSLHSDAYYIFLSIQMLITSFTTKEAPLRGMHVYENVVLRFAHTDFVDADAHGDYFHVLTDRYDYPRFEYSFKINTPFPYHAELHINRTRFDYEGEYFITYDYGYNGYQLQPKFTIDVNSKFCMVVNVCMSNRADQM